MLLVMRKGACEDDENTDAETGLPRWDRVASAGGKAARVAKGREEDEARAGTGEGTPCPGEASSRAVSIGQRFPRGRWQTLSSWPPVPG
jgi:hypothetical protein